MKKFKFLPAIIMLALCVGVIAIGVYVATPANNNIGGTIKVNASSAQISVTALVGDTVVMQPKETRYGFTETIENILEFDVEDKETVAEVDEIVLTIRVQNNSKNKELGAYFYGGNSATPPLQVVYSDIKQNGQVLDSKTQTPFVSETYNENSSGYKHLMPDDSNAQTTNNIVDLTVTFRLIDLYDDEKQGQFSLVLNVEDYNPNFTEDGVYSGNEEFVKVSSSISNNLNSANPNGNVSMLNASPLTEAQTRTSLAANAFAGTEGSPNTSLKMVVIPATVTSIGNNAFAYCTNLTDIHLGSKAITLGTTPFKGIESSTKLKVPVIETKDYKLENKYLTVKDAANITDGFASIGAFVDETYISGEATYNSLEGIKHAKITREDLIWDQYPDSTFVYENGVMTFYNCPYIYNNRLVGLESVVKELHIPSDIWGYNPYIPSQNMNGTFQNFVALEKVVLNSTATLYSGVFAGCTSLKYIYIPSGTEVGAQDFNDEPYIYSAFAGCHTDLKIFFQSSAEIDDRVLVKEGGVYKYNETTYKSAPMYAYQTGVTKEQYTQLTGQTLTID